MPHGLFNKNAGPSSVGGIDSIYLFPTAEGLGQGDKTTPREDQRERRATWKVYLGIRKAQYLFGVDQGQTTMSNWWTGHNAVPDKKAKGSSEERQSKDKETKAEDARSRVERSLQELEDLLHGRNLKLGRGDSSS